MSFQDDQSNPAIVPQEDPSEVNLGVSTADERYVNRELSWLSFNERVLQEAESTSVPLLERIKFLAIFSSNLDEFFRVRVASLRSLLELRRKKRKKKGLDPTELLREIHAIALAQQERFGRVFGEEIVPGLRDARINLVDERGVDGEQRAFIEDYFVEHVVEHLEPMILGREDSPLFLKDHTAYLVAELQPAPGTETVMVDPELGIVEVPSPPLPRFLSMTGPGEARCIIFLDDVIRLNLHHLFPKRVVGGAYAIKVSRDADLYLDDEFDTVLKKAIKKSLKKRETGAPIRFLYDMLSPRPMVARLTTHFGLRDGDLIEGGRYHNLNDLAGLPVGDVPDLEFAPMEMLPHPTLEGGASVLDLIRTKDCLLHFPYQSYGYVLRLLREAASDPDVDGIWISLYRVSSQSEVVKALIAAAENGKDVLAFVEVQARFDEELNLQWAERMELAGIRVIHGTRDIKVHAKLCLIRRREGDAGRLYALLATGNFNEKTAGVYADHGLMTADPRLTAEVHRVFRLLSGEDVTPDFEHLLVAPHHLRDRFNALIDAETKAARARKARRGRRRRRPRRTLCPPYKGPPVWPRRRRIPRRRPQTTAVKVQKKTKKKDGGLGSSRGIETMFRTSYRVHQDLVSLADAKANIMISVNGLIISIILAAVSPRIGGLPLLVLPTSILLVGCVIALVYAVLAARPRVSNTPLTLDDIAQNDANILFFGNFVNLSEEEFVEGMRDLMMTQDHLYVNMVRDLYGLGQVLKTKFQLLRVSYTVFRFALVLGVGLFVVVFALDATIANDLLDPQSALPILP